MTLMTTVLNSACLIRTVCVLLCAFWNLCTAFVVADFFLAKYSVENEQTELN